MVFSSSLGRFGPRRARFPRVLVKLRERRRRGPSAGTTQPRYARRRADAIADTPEITLFHAGRQGQQVADHPPAPLRGLALLEGEHPLEGSWLTGAHREHDFEIRESQGRLVVRPRRPTAVSRHRRASSPGERIVGGLFSILGPFGPRRGRRGVSRVDGVVTRPRRRDAVVVIPRESTWSS